MTPRKGRTVFINYSEYSCVQSFPLGCLNETWWWTSNGGLWDFSLNCLRSLLWMDIFPSTVPLPATCLNPGSSQLWLWLLLGYSSSCILFLTQLWQLPGPHTASPWRPVFHSPHTVILLALQHFSYLYASHIHYPINSLTSSMASPLKRELIVPSISPAIRPAVCKNAWVWMNEWMKGLPSCENFISIISQI